MKNFRDDLGGFRDCHPRTIKEQVSVRESDLAVSDGLEFGPPRKLLQHAPFAQAAFQGKSARGQFA